MIIDAAFQAMLDNTRDLVFVKDINLTYVAASMPFVRMTGKETLEEVVGNSDMDIFEDKGLAKRYVADDRRLLQEGENLIDYIEPLTDEDGEARYGSTSKYILKNEVGVPIGILGITRDITRDYVARQRYQQELKYLFKLPEDTMAVTYIDVDSWRIITQRKQLIKEATLQTCYTVEELCQAAVDSIVEKDCEAARFYGTFTQQKLREIYDSGRSTLSFHYQRYLSDGSIRWVRNEVRFLTDVDSGHLCAMLSAKDIDAKKQEEQKLVEAAMLDKMTGLFNRATTMERIQQILEEEAEKTHVLYMIDIDNFKGLNDTLGHQKGDEFLIALAAEMKGCFRESDVVGRIGGDEFFAFMRNVSGFAVIERKANELLITINRVCAQYPSVLLSGSIGISIYPEQGLSMEVLYEQADMALYEAKRKGKNQYVFA